MRRRRVVVAIETQRTCGFVRVRVSATTFLLGAVLEQPRRVTFAAPVPLTKLELSSCAWHHSSALACLPLELTLTRCVTCAASGAPRRASASDARTNDLGLPMTISLVAHESGLTLARRAVPNGVADKTNGHKAGLRLLKTMALEGRLVTGDAMFCQRAISADEDAIGKLCANYIDNIKAYTQKERVKNKYTGQDEEPDERLMRSIEEKIDIPESRKDDFRREIMNYIGALAIEGRTFNYKTNERLLKALELKLFEDQKDSIKLTSLVSAVVDRDTQEKIDIVKGRLINNYGYCDVCSVDVLNYVASIFARGDSKQR